MLLADLGEVLAELADERAHLARLGLPTEREEPRQTCWKHSPVARARAVLACVDSDAENIFATLTARELRPDIPIVARVAAIGGTEPGGAGFVALSLP